jgi:muramoyltetrapeptide carboxypeptidase
VAPAGPVDPDRLARGLACLRADLGAVELVLADNLHLRAGFLAGDDETRARTLSAALADPGAAAVWCARGGYGTTRLLAGLDPAPLRARPRCVIGFSDATALLCWSWVAAGVSGIHGPGVGQLGGLDPADRQWVIDLLRGEVPGPLAADEGTVLRGGTVEGRLFPGNLEVLRALLGTPFFPELDGGILALEEIGERPYRIDRALTQLLSAGAFRGVRGVIVGQLLGCEEPPGTQSATATARDVVLERLGRLGLPVVTGFAFGHDERRNVALPFGTRARLHADDATLELLESATA